MRRRRWYSAAAHALMRATGIADAQDAVLGYTARLLEEVGMLQPPIDLGIVASFQRVKRIEIVEMPQAGRLVPDGDGLIIQVNANHSRGKRNFTIGHETGHTLLPSYRAKPRLIEDLAVGLYDRGREEEYLCDVAAAELLMPMSLFKPRAAAGGFNLNTMAELASTFRASREATAIRLVQTDLWPCAVALWHYTHKPSQQRLMGQLMLTGFEWATSEKELRVRYAVHSSRFGHYLHRHLAAEADGCLARCYRDGGVLCGEEQLELRGRIVSFQVLAAAMDFQGDGGPVREVLSLLLASTPDQPTHQPHAQLWSAA